MDDTQLLQQYSQTGSHDAFRLLVNRHIGFVHAAALRHVRDPATAEDVTQAVFIVLARKAHTLRHEAVLSSWLLSTTRYAALSAMKMANRRRRHEKKVAEMQAMTTQQDVESQWSELQEMLDHGLHKLRESDRRAILLRFYERKSFAEIGQALGTAEEAARKRVSRAVEQLRAFFGKTGHTVPAALLGTVLFARLSEPASAAMIERTTSIAIGHGTPSPGASRIAGRIDRNITLVRAGWIGSSIAAMLLITLIGASIASAGRNALRQPQHEPPPSVHAPQH